MLFYILSFSDNWKLKKNSFNVYHVFSCKILLPLLVKMNYDATMRSVRNLSQELTRQLIVGCATGIRETEVGRTCLQLRAERPRSTTARENSAFLLSAVTSRTLSLSQFGAAWPAGRDSALAM